jgi:hypothetical protein
VKYFPRGYFPWRGENYFLEGVFFRVVNAGRRGGGKLLEPGEPSET